MPGSYVQGQNVDVGTAYAVSVDAATGLTDTFSAADGTPWDTAKWSVLTANASTATQQGGQGRLAVGTNGAYADKVVAASTFPPRADGGIGFTFVPVNTSQEWYFQVMVRAQTTDFSMGDSSCYRAEVNSSGLFELVERTNGSSAALGGNQSIIGWGVGVPVRVEMYAVGATVALRAWTGSTRPASPLISGTDASPLPAGAVGVLLNGGNAAGVTSVILVDDFTTEVPLS